ncbi:hypothetical protein GQ457_10G017720 [Hibiscus cannabinus]
MRWKRKKGSWSAPPAGIGGILRNHSGSTLVEFSRAIDVPDPALAEFYCYKRGYGDLCKKTKWSVSRFMSWEVTAVDRNQNTDADLLAKAGINRNLAHIKVVNFSADKMAKAGFSRGSQWFWEVDGQSNQCQSFRRVEY